MKRLLFWIALVGAVVVLLRRLGVIEGAGDDKQSTTHSRPPVPAPDETPWVDPAHAPGHSHLGPPPRVPKLESVSSWARNQPWVRRSHLDSQQRRYRR